MLFCSELMCLIMYLSSSHPCSVELLHSTTLHNMEQMERKSSGWKLTRNCPYPFLHYSTLASWTCNSELLCLSFDYWSVYTQCVSHVTGGNSLSIHRTLYHVLTFLPGTCPGLIQWCLLLVRWCPFLEHHWPVIVQTMGVVCIPYTVLVCSYSIFIGCINWPPVVLAVAGMILSPNNLFGAFFICCT